jgi:hypothetical protein
MTSQQINVETTELYAKSAAQVPDYMTGFYVVFGGMLFALIVICLIKKYK